VTTHAAEIRRREAVRAFYLAMLTTFAVLATVLAATGIFGVVAHVTGLRVREFGIRLALGARSTQLDARVVRDALVPVTAGLAAGLGVAWWLGGLLTANTVFMAQLYEVTPRDPTTLGAVLMLLLGVAVLAAWLPARRATRVDPARVLHAE
jgi:ABC-type antimicrobial peptide transport system permease subunit